MVNVNDLIVLHEALSEAGADTVQLFLIKKVRQEGDVNYEILEANIGPDVGKMLKDAAVYTVGRYLEDPQLLPYEPMLEPDRDTVLHIEAEEVPEAINWVQEAESLDLSNFDLDNSRGLHGYFIKIGNDMWAFQRHGEGKFLQKNWKQAILSQDGTFQMPERQPATFAPDFDAIMAANTIFLCCRTVTFEELFAFASVIEDMVKKNFDILKDQSLISNPEDLRGHCVKDQRKMRKLYKILSKPEIVKKITTDELLQSVKVHQTDLEIGEDGKLKIETHTDAWRLLKLIDEDYFIGTFSGQHYEAHSKALK